ncbi:hypothetical protein FQA39_LY09471 [Lamprigera yunnana]|nr:hypothetical protein FQA39_LY09471 [Lamprigera yunnana]
MTSSSCGTNKLAEGAQRKRWGQRRTILTPLKSNQLLDFPELTERDLKILFTRTYQLSQTMSSLAEIVDEEENINLQFEKEIPNIVQVHVQSRHIKRQMYRVYVKYKPRSSGVSSIPGYCCEFANGLRTVGCCSHVSAVIYYLSHGRLSPESNKISKNPERINKRDAGLVVTPEYFATKVNMSRIASLKLSESNTMRLLELFKGEPCLYDVNLSEYRNRDLRAAATQRIASALSVEGFGPKEVVAKFKNLRNSYSQELKKLYDSEKSGAPNDVYIPRVYWFQLMDSFLRPQMYSRPSKYNFDISNNIVKNKNAKTDNLGDDMVDDEDEHENFIEQPFVHNEEDENSILDILALQSQERIQRETEADSLHHYFKRSSASTSGGTRKKRCTSPKREISQMVFKKHDMYDHFGKFVASVLRKVGDQTAMVMINDITNILMKHVTSYSSRPTSSASTAS